MRQEMKPGHRRRQSMWMESTLAAGAAVVGAVAVAAGTAGGPAGEVVPLGMGAGVRPDVRRASRRRKFRVLVGGRRWIVGGG